MTHNLAVSIRLIFLLASLSLWHGLNAEWNRHTIDDTSNGADGVRLEDVNGDGLMDIATGWEEGGLVRIYLNPGKDKVHSLWPSVTWDMSNPPRMLYSPTWTVMASWMS